MNDQLAKDVSRGLSQIKFNQELPPGTPRRWEPDCGTSKHEERIRKETKYAVEHKNLPFTIRKPPKPRGYSTYISCNNCGYVTKGTSATAGMICPSCKKFAPVTEVGLS